MYNRGININERNHMSTKAQIKASVRYNQRNVKMIAVGLNKNLDADIIEWIAKQPGSTQGVIKKLIRNEIAAGR